MNFISKIILLVGLPAGILVGMDLGGLLAVPPWLFTAAYATVALVLLTGVLAGIFGKVE